MEIMLIGLAVTVGIELVVWLPGFWKLRKPLAACIILALAVLSGVLLGRHPALWTGLLAIFSVYRIINLLRLVDGRVRTDYLYRVARSSSLWLIAMQLVVLALAGIDYQYHIRSLLWWYLLVSVQLGFGLVLLTSTWRHLRTTRSQFSAENYADRDLPTLSVAIPARNETDDLEACLKSLLTSTYPKLEILVLDDCSQNKKTPEIIRSYAQSGVRFVAGKLPPEQWLAKNYAYLQLADQANGELLLFCGVDTRFTPSSLDALVKTMLQRKKTMLSLLPRNIAPSRGSFGSLMVQPTRYAWELALPRRWLQRPPVLSTCWLINSQALHEAGGFDAVSRANSPESYFARWTANHNDGYSFLQSSAQIGLTSTKSFSEQQATAIRTRYPQLHRRPELTALLSLSELAVLFVPFVIFSASLLTGHLGLALLSGLSIVMLIAFYALIVRLTYRKFMLRGLWLLPLAAIYDLGLLNYSMWQYEFNEVIWKGRNVCIPVMRATSSLPPIDQ